MALSLEMRVSSAGKKLASLRRQRGELAIDDDNSKFQVISTQIDKVERDIRQLENAMQDASAERKRREAIEAPRKRAEAHASLLASLKAAETARLETIGAAEISARELVEKFKRVIAASRQARKIADQTKIFRGDASPMDDAAMLGPPNLENRLSLLLSAVMSPLCTGGFFGLLNLSAPGHQHVGHSVSWTAFEAREVVGLIAAFEKAK